MKKEHIYMISIPAAALVLAAAIALTILAVSGALSVTQALLSIAFFFAILLCLGITVFANKMFTGKLHDIIFTFGSAILISFFLAIIVFALIVNKADFSNFDWFGVFERMMYWDWRFYGIQFGVFLVFGAIYFGFIDRDMWKFMRYTGLRGKGKLKQMEANLENSRWMEDD